MKYRIVQLTDGKYLAQYRYLFLFWADSIKRPSHDYAEHVWFVERCGAPTRARVHRVVKP